MVDSNSSACLSISCDLETACSQVLRKNFLRCARFAVDFRHGRYGDLRGHAVNYLDEAFLQLSVALKLWYYVASDKICLAEFDIPLTIQSDEGSSFSMVVLAGTN